MDISIKIRQAYSEINEFISLLSEEQKNKLPNKLKEFFIKEKDNTYQKKINPHIPIKDQNLLEETLAIIALLNLKYWCDDEKERNRLQTIYIQNEKNYQEILYKKYNPNNLFKKK